MNLSIKNVPEDLVQRLRERATANHRSLQGELMAILQKNLTPARFSTDELWSRAKASGLRTTSESASMIREDRDSDHGRDPLP